MARLLAQRDTRVTQLSRSHTFAVPSTAVGSSRHLQIAIRLGPRFLSGIGLNVFAGGSYVPKRPTASGSRDGDRQSKCNWAA